MNYLNGKFSVFAPDSEQYRSNWDRIFGPKGDKAIEAAILAHARKLHADDERGLFWPRDFSHITFEDVAIDALDALARSGCFSKEYRVYCADGHAVYGGNQMLDHNVPCPYCANYIDLADEDTYVVRNHYLLVKP